jgi:hypothetical protein
MFIISPTGSINTPITGNNKRDKITYTSFNHQHFYSKDNAGNRGIKNCGNPCYCATRD